MKKGNQTILSVRDLSKKFFLNPALGRRPGAWELVKMMIGFAGSSAKLSENEFWAIKDISFELSRGEAIGIMGMNGAGKSTLLKVLLGRLSPDSGSFRVRGSVGGLVELGAGFHAEMTGKENIYNKARLLGVTDDEIDKRIDDIVEFADLGEFIHSPVKTYSSGMNIRLGFSIAIHFVEDLILCDEILAVGDFDFRQKCLAKINELRNYKSFVLVSHNTRDISTFCSKAILLHKGEVVAEGDPEEVIEAYAQCSHHISAAEVRRRISGAASVVSNDRKKEKVSVSKERKFFYENVAFKQGLECWTHAKGNGKVEVSKNCIDYSGTKGTFTLRQEIDRISDTRVEFDLTLKSGELELLRSDGSRYIQVRRFEKGHHGKVEIEMSSKCVWFRGKDIEKQNEGLRFLLRNLKVKEDVRLKREDKEEKEIPDITDESKLSLFGPEFFRRDVIEKVEVFWNLRKRESGFYYVSGDVFGLRIKYELKKDLNSLRIGIPFFRLTGEMIIGPDSRNNPSKEALKKKGKHQVDMIIDPLPVNEGRMWMTVTLCEDPAHLYRKHIGFFDIINPAQEYGTVKTFPVWGRNLDLRNLESIDGKI